MLHKDKHCHQCFRHPHSHEWLLMRYLSVQPSVPFWHQNSPYNHLITVGETMLYIKEQLFILLH